MHSRTTTALLIALAFLAGTCLTAYSATTTGPRYTLRERVKLNAHNCAEDEYMFIPSKHVNRNVNYNTPDVAMCVHVDNTRRAP